VTDYVKIGLSRGLILAAIAIALTHAAAIGYVSSVLHTPKPKDPSWQVPVGPQRPMGQQYSAYEKFEEPPHVNLSAQSEMKEQSCATGTCNTRVTTVARRTTNPWNLAPGERLLNVGPVAMTPVAPIAKPTTPTATPAVYDPLVAPPAPMVIPAVSAAQPTKPKAKYQVAFFIDKNAQNQTMYKWFDTHPNLVSLKEASEFQRYSASNQLYLTRYAETIPVAQFPVVLVQDATGGHIHAAARAMIPNTSDELWADILAGALLWRQAKQGDIQMTGALKTKGYSWDDKIRPDMRLTSTDCPDGFCPDPSEARTGPFDRIFNRDQPSKVFDVKNLLVWAGVSDIATLAVFVLIGITLIYILARRQ